MCERKCMCDREVETETERQHVDAAVGWAPVKNPLLPPAPEELGITLPHLSVCPWFSASTTHI